MKAKEVASTKRAESEKRRKAQYSRDRTADLAEIGKPPLTARQLARGRQLRAKCEGDLLFFNVKLFPNTSGLKPLGDVQVASIEHDQSVIQNGGQIAKAEPRGYGKTTRTCNASLWGALNGYRRMIPVFSANTEKSKTQIMARWKMEIMTNELLFMMFPEIIWPLRALGNRPQRCATQTYNGELTHTQWTGDRIVFPTVPGHEASGSVLVALPLKSCRGATHTTPTGEILRPDLLNFDDVQKDEDAENPNTIRKLVDLIDHTAMMLGGHSQTLAAIMTCTVRKPDDLSEHYLGNASWRRVRYKMLEKRATHEKMWLGEYAKIRRSFDPESPDSQDKAKLSALKFYKSNRKKMDSGAAVTWKWAYAWADKKKTEISAIQHAYNILIDRGESVFLSECQNEPVASQELASLMPAEQIKNKTNGLDRGTLPTFTEKVVAHIDVQQNILPWKIVAGSSQYECAVVDYGHWPKQRRRYFERSKASPDFNSFYPNQQVESQVYRGLDDLVSHLAGLRLKTPAGAEFEIDLVLIDSRAWTSTVNLFIAQNSHRIKVLPAQGVGVGAKDTPFALRQKYQGETHGHHYIVKRPKSGGPDRQRYVQVDTNYWKTKLHQLLRAGIGSASYLALFGNNPDDHEMLADHYRSEYPTQTEGRGRRLDEWRILPHRPDNDLLDNAVGCLVALAIEGCRLPGTNSPAKPRPVSLAALQKRGRQ